jgi:hypothetical protein
MTLECSPAVEFRSNEPIVAIVCPKASQFVSALHYFCRDGDSNDRENKGRTAKTDAEADPRWRPQARRSRAIRRRQQTHSLTGVRYGEAAPKERRKLGKHLRGGQ